MVKDSIDDVISGNLFESGKFRVVLLVVSFRIS